MDACVGRSLGPQLLDEMPHTASEKSYALYFSLNSTSCPVSDDRSHCRPPTSATHGPLLTVDAPGASVGASCGGW